MTMLLDVETIREPNKRVERTEPPTAFEPEDVFRIVAPVELRLNLHKDKAKVRLTGTVKTTVEVDCSRCLEGFQVPIASTFDVQYLPATAAPADSDREVDEQELDTAFYQDGVIDLRQLVREQIFLMLPMKPLCQESCAGLCPVCGTNLNTGSCECSPEWEDPRLAPLKALARKSDTDA
ncbi:MAG TPA: DUF177 domain-containing protein [Vicinamibacterales bacterium]|jgi:uncharacterized protein|nr:DUF177 domain-containing protein [Vicinamibacterales bacterium]